MKKLDERKKGFEGKFARDQELEFKILARRNKYLGVWAAEKLRLSGPAVEEYFAEVIKSDLEEDGDMDVFRKVRKFVDFGIHFGIIFDHFWHYFSILFRHRFLHAFFDAFFATFGRKWSPNGSFKDVADLPVAVQKRAQIFPKT